MMKIALCIITKGDEELNNVVKAVASVSEYVTAVYITTNSKKYKKVEEWCSKDDKLNHSHLDWSDNFSQQRNFNFSQVPEDFDWILWMDSDDVILNAHLLPDIAKISKKQGIDTVFFDYWYGAKFDGEPSEETFVENEITHYRERLIRPGSVVWKKRIHESPVPVDPQNYRYSKVTYSKAVPIAWLHLGASRDALPEFLEKKMARNRRLLRMELEDERASGEADPRTILYLMKIEAESRDEEVLKGCVELGKEYLLKSGWDQERAECCRLMGRCLGTLGDHKKAFDYIMLAIKEYPRAPLSYLYLARECFNLKNYGAMKHWMEVGLSIDTEKNPAAMKNILELKLLSAELMLQYYHVAEKNPRKAYRAARLLNKLNPTEQNAFNEEFLYDLKELDIASEHVHMFLNYLRDIRQEETIPKVLDLVPPEMRRLPFANRYYNMYSRPRNWKDNEICYFANFGSNHFENWDGNSLKTGIGGSETAVIRLSEEWVKLGYKVTVYGDPEKECTINGVLYKPWYTFNIKDRFNIFIQWRSSNIVKKINAKKVLIDLHDVYHQNTHIHNAKYVDKFMVKSLFHRNFGKDISDEKMEIISNGID